MHHIDVTVFPLQRALDQSEESLFSHSRHRGQSQREFDASVFYHNLLTCAGDEDDGEILNPFGPTPSIIFHKP